MNTRTCKYCSAPIRFVPTAGGSRMPINPDPDPAGNVVMQRGVAVVVTAGQHTDLDVVTRYMPHRATCTGRAPRRR